MITYFKILYIINITYQPTNVELEIYIIIQLILNVRLLTIFYHEL